MQSSLESMFKVMFKDAKLTFLIKEKKEGCRDFTLDLYCPSSTQHSIGAFTRIASNNSELEKHCRNLLSALKKEIEGKNLNRVKTTESSQIPLTFKEFKEKHTLDWDDFKRLLFVSNTHIWKEKQTTSPLLAFGFGDGGFLKVRGKTLSLGTKNVVLDVVSPTIPEEDFPSGRTKEFFQWQNTMKCALKLSRQFSLSTYPVEEQEKIEKNVNNIEFLNAYSKTIFFNLLNKLSSPEKTFEDLPNNPVKVICEIFKEKYLQTNNEQCFEKENPKAVSTTNKMK